MHEYRRILAVVDFTDSGRAVARRALGLARLGQAELLLLHLIEPTADLDGGYPQPSRKTSQKSYEAEGLRRLDFFAATLGADEAILQVRFGQPRAAFVDCIAAWRPDLVVADNDPGHLGGRHDLLTLGRGHNSGGRLMRLFLHLIGSASFTKASIGS